jgi:hypothetical protein
MEERKHLPRTKEKGRRDKKVENRNDLLASVI